MNTCLLHFVAFKIFIEEQTEGELMHRINDDCQILFFIALKILTQALQYWTVPDLCGKPETGSFQH